MPNWGHFAYLTAWHFSVMADTGLACILHPYSPSFEVLQYFSHLLFVSNLSSVSLALVSKTKPTQNKS